MLILNNVKMITGQYLVTTCYINMLQNICKGEIICVILKQKTLARSTYKGFVFGAGEGI